MSQDQAHGPGFRAYLAVLAVLLILTAVTVGIAQIDFGALNALIAMLIASVKGALVLLYFMHLKYDGGIYWTVFGSSVFFVILLYFFSKLDIMTRVIPEAFL